MQSLIHSVRGPCTSFNKQTTSCNTNFKLLTTVLHSIHKIEDKGKLLIANPALEKNLNESHDKCNVRKVIRKMREKKQLL